jgi:hypothetical protein
MEAAPLCLLLNKLDLFSPAMGAPHSFYFSEILLQHTEHNSINWLIDRLIDWLICIWIRTITVPMHLVLNWRILCAAYQFSGALVCWISVRAKFRNYSIINVHAPTEDKDDEEKDKFLLTNMYPTLNFSIQV